MGQRERKRRHAAAQPPAPPAPPPGYARGRERDEAARAALEPLAPGERPLSVTIAAVVAFGLALANFISWLAGVEINDKKPAVGGVLAFCAVMFAAAWGIWTLRYWAVLGFEALLALIVVVFFLFLLRASDLAAVGVCVVVIAGAGALFYKLIRAMARMQAPSRP
jgi:hypothetical protein